jgi:2-oxoglutarate/2-oxoacid ferredoxin oxidoreductase subunit beta
MRHNLTKIQRCPGCGDYLIHMAIKQAIQELWIPKEKLVVVTGIGCNSKMSQYLDCNGVESLHGRGIPFATGVKLANPELTVISLSGDGDSYGIWVGHLIHASRRNLDFVHITADNENYALTTGQASPTTPLDIKTRSTPEWNRVQPMHPIELAKVAWCGFAEMVVDKDIKKMKETIIAAIKHPWFAHINVQQNCPSWKRW